MRADEVVEDDEHGNEVVGRRKRGKTLFGLVPGFELLVEALFAEPFSHNAASCRILEKSGFVLEGILRKNAIKNGQVIDMKMYALKKA